MLSVVTEPVELINVLSIESAEDLRVRKLTEISQNETVFVSDIHEFLTSEEIRFLRKKKIHTVKVAKPGWDASHDLKVEYFKSYIDYYGAMRDGKYNVTYRVRGGDIIGVKEISFTKFYVFDPETCKLETFYWWFFMGTDDKKHPIAPSNIGGMRLKGNPLPKGYGKK